VVRDGTGAIVLIRAGEHPPLPETRAGFRRTSRTYSRRSLHGQVAHDIGSRIVSGELAPGSLLPNEAELSVRFAISRTALREAMKVLAAKGMVESRPKIGTRIRPRDEWNMLDPDLLSWQFATQPIDHFAQSLFEIRRIIEPPAAALAAERGTEEHLAAIAEAYDSMAATAHEGDMLTEHDLRFHQAILTASENDLLRPMGVLIETALHTSFRIANSYPGAGPESLPRHRAVLDGILARDPGRARMAMETLIEMSKADIDRALADQARGPTRFHP
jgi:DNA-binding FadR family transcriptional regulator